MNSHGKVTLPAARKFVILPSSRLTVSPLTQGILEHVL
jgi:hypothetical protein